MNHSLAEEKREQIKRDKGTSTDLEQKVAAQTKELAALNAIAAAVSQSLDLNDVLNNALDKTLEVMETEAGGIYLLDERTGVLNIVVQRGFEPDFVAGIDKLKLGEGFSGHVAKSGQPLLVRDISTDPHFTRMVVQAAGLRSAAIIPLSSKGKVLGTFFTIARSDREFSEQDVQLLTSIGHQIGVAIENTRLYEDTKNQLAQLTTLQETISAVVSTLELDQLLNLIIQQATNLLQADGGMINLVDWEERTDEVVSATGEVALTLGFSSPLDDSLSGWVTIHNQPIITNEVQSDSRVDPTAQSYILEKNIKSAAVAPLAIKDQVVGTLVVVGTRDGKKEFDQPGLDLLVTFANHAAIAIENARLYEQAQQRMRELEALYRADEELYRHLSLDDVLQALVDIGVDILKADKSSLMVWDEMCERFVARVARGFSPETMALLSFARGEGTFGHVAATGEPVIVNDAFNDPRRKDERPEVVQAALFSEGIRSFMHLPIKIGDEVFGVFSAIFTTPRTFGEDDLRRFTAIAERAALAIENARLYEHAQQVATLEERNRLARELHDSVKQQALAASFQLGTAITLFDGDSQTAKKHLLMADNLVDAIRKELTDLILELRPQMDERKDVAETLNDYAVEWAHQSGIEVHVDVQESTRLALEVKQALFRILQESLANVARHSSAECVDVVLRVDDDIQLIIKDDGQGFDARREHSGMGLQSMKERAESLDGTFTVESEPGEGTRVSVTLPVGP
jgi:GAF domain-containing protein/anti-sigma regulatory factor (Ser/Thr protein kinase)